jgi:hypothetical protein
VPICSPLWDEEALTTVANPARFDVLKANDKLESIVVDEATLTAASRRTEGPLTRFRWSANFGRPLAPASEVDRDLLRQTWL